MSRTLRCRQCRCSVMQLGFRSLPARTTERDQKRGSASLRGEALLRAPSFFKTNMKRRADMSNHISSVSPQPSEEPGAFDLKGGMTGARQALPVALSVG